MNECVRSRMDGCGGIIRAIEAKAMNGMQKMDKGKWMAKQWEGILVGEMAFTIFLSFLQLVHFCPVPWFDFSLGLMAPMAMDCVAEATSAFISALWANSSLSPSLLSRWPCHSRRQFPSISSLLAFAACLWWSAFHSFAPFIHSSHIPPGPLHPTFSILTNYLL